MKRPKNAFQKSPAPRVGGDEGAEHVAQRLGRGGLVGGGFLARPDQHGEQARDAHEDAAEGEPGHRGAGFGDEAGADDGAERVADGGAHAPEGGHGAADGLRDAVGQDRDGRGQHHIEAHHAHAVNDGDHRGVRQDADGEERQAAQDAAADDPGAALAEARAGAVGEVAEDEVGDQ